MAFIRYPGEAELPPGQRVADPDNIIQIHRVHPEVMRQHYDLYRELMHGRGPLSRRHREMLGVRVSALNGCHYCLTHHGAGLRQILGAAGIPPGEQNAMIAALRSGDFGAGCLDGRDRALLAYADKLTMTPGAISQDDVQRLTAAGFDDRGIHDACAIVAYFAFVNRIADGLGVELEHRAP